MIEEAISGAIVRHEGVTDQQAREYIHDLKSEGRWVVEAYSSRITKNLDIGNHNNLITKDHMSRRLLMINVLWWAYHRDGGGR